MKTAGVNDEDDEEMRRQTSKRDNNKAGGGGGGVISGTPNIMMMMIIISGYALSSATTMMARIRKAAPAARPLRRRIGDLLRVVGHVLDHGGDVDEAGDEHLAWQVSFANMCLTMYVWEK